MNEGAEKGARVMLQGSRREESRPAMSIRPIVNGTSSPTNPSNGTIGTIAKCHLEQSVPETESAMNWDRLLRAQVGRLTMGLSPPGLLLVYLDWLVHLGFSPGKQLDLLRKMCRKALRLGVYATRSLRPDTPSAI